MKYLSLLIASLFFTLSFPVLAQNYKLSAEPGAFITDVKTMMAGSRNEAAIKTAAQLEQIWNTSLTKPQQTKVVDIAQKMLLKKLKARPHFESFFGLLVSGVTNHQLGNTRLDELLNVTGQSLEKDEVKSFEQFLATTYAFLNGKMLYKSQYNALKVLNGNFSFEYRPGTQASLKEIQASLPDFTAVPVAVPEDPLPAAATNASPATNIPAATNEEDDFWSKASKPKAPAKKGAAGKKTVAKAPVKKATPVKTPAPAVKPAPVVAAAPNYTVPVTGAVLLLQNVDLQFITPQDSLVLKNTAGAVLLTRQTFVGTKGQFDWNQGGAQASATFKEFHFDVSKPAFKAEHVTIANPALLENPVEGIFEYRSVKAKPGLDTGYPKFVSYTNNARVKTIGEGIKYLGGLTLAGKKIGTGALDKSLSKIIVEQAGKPMFKASAANYVLSDTLIAADVAGIVIYRGKDSITHPTMRFKYSKPRRLLSLISDEGSFKKSPFFDSYHQMEIAAEMLTWNLNTPQINYGIVNAKNQVPARLDSREYFTLNRWMQVQGTADFHPLKVAVSFAARQKSDRFYAADLARDVNIKEPVIRGSLSALQKQGFIHYNAGTGLVVLKPKAWHYVSSSREKKDYDYITLTSLAPSGKNAMLNLNTNELVVRGVTKFYLTGDSAAVYVVPDSNQVRILQNRDIKFNGTVHASYFRFVGKEFTFNYKDFLVDMNKIDSIAFATRKKVADMKGGEEKVREQFLVSRSNKSSGKLYLNKPDNKSGKKKIGGYPSFDALSPTYVYFNKPEILGGAYDTTMYFAVPPFKMDSLNSSKPGAIGFKGRFHSGGIFPDFNTTLGIMPDQSLGFEYQIPKGGFDAYGGKGKYFNKLTMNFKGLQGAGELKYLTTTLQSNAFTFYLDKTLTLGTKAVVAEGNIGDAYYMQANFKQYALEWLPRKDTMNISTTVEPIKMYNDKFNYSGTAIITPKGFAGDGRLESAEAVVTAPILHFNKTDFTGNNATLEVKSKTPNKPVIRATDVKLDFNLKDGYAGFSPEKAGFASTAFPNAQFKTSLSGGKWDFKKKLVTLNQPQGATADKAYFVSTKKEHGNLKFKAASGIFDLTKQDLKIGGVPYIAAADMHIVPDSGQVFVSEKAVLRPFKNATVVDTAHKYHPLYQGEVQVLSRTQFKGSATYNYVNAAADTYKLNFGKFAMYNMKAEEVKPEVQPKKYTAAQMIAAANAAENPKPAPVAAKKGLFQKVGLSKGKAATKPLDAKPTDSTAVADPVGEEIAVADTKKSKKAAQAEKAARQEAGSDSTEAILLASTEPVKLPGRRKRKEPATFGTVPYTSATATIKEEDKFFISPNVQFRGQATMSSNKEFLDFSGFIKLGFAKEEGASDWIPYIASNVNPKEVKIDIQQGKDNENTPMITGLHISSATGKLYPTFGSKKADADDLDVFTTNGLLSFDKATRQYKLGKAKQAAEGDTYEGNLMTYNDATSEARYDGKFNLIQSGKSFGLTAAGAMQAKINDNQYRFNSLLAFDIPMHDQAVTAMGNAIADNNGGAPAAIDANAADLQTKLAEFVGPKGAQEYIAKAGGGHVPLPAFSAKLARTLLFSNVDLHWSDSTKAWYSQGKLGLSNIGKKDIDAQIPGYIEIKRGPESDIVTIYLEPIPSLWYYISYADNGVVVASADDKVNGIIASKRSGGVQAGEAIEKAEFVNYFRKTYLGLEPLAPDKVAPSSAPDMDFMEQGETSKKGRKAKKATEAQDEPADMEVAPAEKATKPASKAKEVTTGQDLPAEAPAAEPKKKKKSKKADNDALPDIDLN